MIPKVYEFIIYGYSDPQQTKLCAITTSRLVARSKRNAIRWMNEQLELRDDVPNPRYVVLEKSWLRSLLTLLIPKIKYNVASRWEEP